MSASPSNTQPTIIIISKLPFLEICFWVGMHCFLQFMFGILPREGTSKVSNLKYFFKKNFTETYYIGSQKTFENKIKMFTQKTVNVLYI